VYAQRICALWHLQEGIYTAVVTITPDMLHLTSDKIKYRLDVYMATNWNLLRMSENSESFPDIKQRTCHIFRNFYVVCTLPPQLFVCSRRNINITESFCIKNNKTLKAKHRLPVQYSTLEWHLSLGFCGWSSMYNLGFGVQLCWMLSIIQHFGKQLFHTIN
jgi:hypothetical protein